MLSKKRTGQLTAPADGATVHLRELPDPAFAQGMLGDGVALDPTDGHFVSPCDGIVVGVSDTLHAYNLLTDDGLELLLHIGIDTVELKGEGFSTKVKEGDRVKAGDPLAEVDLDLIRARGYSTLTPLIVTNMELLSSLSCQQGSVRGGKDRILRYEIRK
ncbi:MAG: PTS glucose transporter subunit IIA [Clostridia bacterium]|nr:PTS glucose transporter subunit IIA [Clostridia bacterium]